jgi:hypothetical protein
VSTTTLLQERGQTHGHFADNARYAQMLRALWRSSPAWHTMPDEHREALDHMAGKFSRILSGQSRYGDHWKDVAGYATLALKVCDPE